MKQTQEERAIRRAAAARKRYAEREDVREKIKAESKKQSKTARAKEWRKNYKRKLRRDAGCRLRADIPAQVEAKRQKQERARAERALEREAQRQARIKEKPWTDHTLTDAQRWKIRYELDPEWREKEYARLINQKMLRRYKMQTPGVSGAEIKALKDAHHQCAYCAKPLTHQQKTVDHVVALSRGGLHEIGNLTIACGPCNRAKSNRDADEFRQWLANQRAA